MKKTIRPITGVLEIQFNATTKQRDQIALYQQGSIRFIKESRNNWIVTFKYDPTYGDALSLNANASTVADIAKAGKVPFVDKSYCKRIHAFYKTAKESPESIHRKIYA